MTAVMWKMCAGCRTESLPAPGLCPPPPVSGQRAIGSDLRDKVRLASGVTAGDKGGPAERLLPRIRRLRRAPRRSLRGALLVTLATVCEGLGVLEMRTLGITHSFGRHAQYP